jgi:enterochelin esterase-like enzyme
VARTIQSSILSGLLTLSAIAQTGQPHSATQERARTVATPYNALVSPEVHADRTVTLRFRAPDATHVDLTGEITLGHGAQAMTKGEDGIWTLTVGPLPAEIWSYNFRVQGIDVPDPSNPSIKPVPPGFPISSFVEVPGDSPAFYDSRPVPHGDVRIVMYESKAMGLTRFVWIYTPPGYDEGKGRYPVLYLLHGNGEAQNGWVMNGRANIILDNLIAGKKARPMIVVMPQGHALQAAGVAPLERLSGETQMYSERFPQDLLRDVIPLVEQRFRVLADADHRAIAGLSMGGGQALMIGLAHQDLFHYVLGYSAAISKQFMGGEGGSQDLVADAAKANPKLRLLWLSCGKQDFLYQANRQLADELKAKRVNLTYREREGAHVWSVWRNNLNESAPLLFR